MSLFVSLLATCPTLWVHIIWYYFSVLVVFIYVFLLSLLSCPSFLLLLHHLVFQRCLLHHPYCLFYWSLSSHRCGFSFVSLPRLPKGPFFRFQTYMDWLKQPNPLALPSWEPCLKRLKMVPVFGVLFVTVNYYFPLSYVRTDEFLDQNIFFR